MYLTKQSISSFYLFLIITSRAAKCSLKDLFPKTKCPFNNLVQIDLFNVYIFCRELTHVQRVC